MNPERRRSDRLMLRVPLRVSWLEGTVRVECDGYTTAVNRHGARVQVPRPLPEGATVRMVNTVSNREADFQVVGLVAPRTGEGALYGLAGPMARRSAHWDPDEEELTWAGEEFWGVHFPPPEPEEAAEGVATIECRSCHTLAQGRLTLVEADVLETAGVISLECEVCRRPTHWVYAKKTSVAPEAPDVLPEPGAEQMIKSRRHHRVSLKLPVMIRRYSGGVEITQTDDVSKGGFGFTSEKDYYVGEGLMVACPYSGTDVNIEVQAQIVRRQPINGTENKQYGVKYAGAEP
jgi:PilZ domain